MDGWTDGYNYQHEDSPAYTPDNHSSGAVSHLATPSDLSIDAENQDCQHSGRSLN